MKSTTYKDEPAIRGTAQEFILERKYLKNVTTKTLDWYGHSFRAFEGCEGREDYVKRIGELRERGVSAISVNTYLRCINAYLNWKGAEFKLPRLKEEQKILQTLPNKDLSVILSFKPRGTNQIRAHIVILTLLDTGLRCLECITLTKSQIDLDNCIIRVKGKGGKHRLVAFSLELRKHLYRYLKGHNHNVVFATKGGTPVSVRNIERDIKQLCDDANITGVRCSPHTFRHTFATTWIRNGGDLFLLSKTLGHSSITTTQRYLQSLGIEDIKKAHSQVSPLAVR